MSGRALLAVGILAASTLCSSGAGGGAPPPPPSTSTDVFWCDAAHTTSCPIGATCLPSGGCWSAEASNAFEDAGCNAVACEALARSALERGNDCVELCAAWCFSSCAGDVASIAEDQHQMRAEGCDEGACRF